MALNTTPYYVSTPFTDPVAFSTANPNIDGSTGTYATLHTAGGDGSRVYAIRLKPVGDITADELIRLWIYNGVSRFLFDEIAVQRADRGGTRGITPIIWQPGTPLGYIDLEASHRFDASTVRGVSWHAVTIGYSLAAPA